MKETQCERGHKVKKKPKEIRSLRYREKVNYIEIK